MKKTFQILLVAVLSLALFGCGKSEGIIKAEKAIKEIGEVTLDSGEAIERAEKAVEELSSEDKDKFKMHDELEEIKDKFEQLKEEKKVNDIIKLIDELGEITLESGEKIDAAQKALDEIPDEYKEKVTNRGKLDEAVNTLKTLRTAEKERIIAEKTGAFNQEHDKVENITWYQHKEIPRYIDIRSYIIPYIGQRGNNVWICTRYNYTADEWIFWENLTIMVDGEKHFKYVGRSNTIRDNDTEVWEYYNEVYDSNVGMENEDLQLLKAISESNETIIRFQGDEYHYDLTVSATDKKIISDVLTLYQALLW